jgi:flagellar assembly factor FliW
MSEMLSIKSSRFGDLEVPKESVIEILGGVLGFPNETKFVLLEYNPPFSWLQSIENDSLAFAVVNAAEFGEEYSVAVPWGDADLGLEDDAAIAILNLVTVRPDPTMTTVNLKAPIVVCLKTMRGKQVILDDEKYPVRFPLWSPG